MGSAATLNRLNVHEYLAWEDEQAERHEFVDGEVFAMAGAEDRHVTVAGNVYTALRRCLGGTPCRTYITDMKLHVHAANSYFYPDVMVTCATADHAQPLVKSQPKLLVEVLSPSTAAFDRGAKFASYRLLPSLEEFALIDPDSRGSDVYRKGADGLWVLHPFEPGAPVTLACVGLAIEADDLFADVDPPPA